MLSPLLSILRSSPQNLRILKEIRATLKLKTNRNYSVYEMGCPLRNPSLFTLKFLIVLKSRIVAKSQTLA